MKQEMVKEGYNKVAENYSNQRGDFSSIFYLEKLENLLKENSTVLDIGCGAGVPVDKYLIEKGCKVIGIDISDKQIDLARKNLPQGNFEVRDMSNLKDNEYQVDAVVSFYAIFHVPKETHQKIFNKINSFLCQGGLILVTMGASEWEGEENFHGTQMYWSHYGPEKNREIIQEAGFEIIFEEIDESGGEKHQIIIGKKL
ncbi:MAG: class I SAM-dependent methyltransferase [Patescibacteria group bacterium]|nr:class I SAM-dependent methyltransferase [Patescibacteria group bacterium]